jgi:hypothetical protein
MKIFKVGDFVRVREGVHDPGMPASRMGHLIAPFETVVHYAESKKERTDVWILMMANGTELKFHKMHLEHV